MAIQRRKPEQKPADPRQDVFYSALGDRVKRLREAVGLTQAALGQRSGFSVAAINGVERGRQRMPLIGLLQLWEALGIPDSVHRGEGMRMLIPRWDSSGDATGDLEAPLRTLERGGSELGTIPTVATAVRELAADTVADGKRRLEERAKVKPARPSVKKAKPKAKPKSKAKAKSA
jgi:transcriptional regulator with XRE-family HTH domain